MISPKINVILFLWLIVATTLLKICDLVFYINVVCFCEFVYKFSKYIHKSFSDVTLINWVINILIIISVGTSLVVWMNVCILQDFVNVTFVNLLTIARTTKMWHIIPRFVFCGVYHTNMFHQEPAVKTIKVCGNFTSTALAMSWK